MYVYILCRVKIKKTKKIKLLRWWSCDLIIIGSLWSFKYWPNFSCVYVYTWIQSAYTTAHTPHRRARSDLRAGHCTHTRVYLSPRFSLPWNNNAGFRFLFQVLYSTRTSHLAYWNSTFVSQPDFDVVYAHTYYNNAIIDSINNRCSNHSVVIIYANYLICKIPFLIFRTSDCLSDITPPPSTGIEKGLISSVVSDFSSSLLICIMLTFVL